MSDFKEFPKMMRHPSAQPAVLSTIFKLGYKPQPGEVENPGKPATLPPITVNDANQQAMYEARGYIAEDGDGMAFANASAATIPAGYVHNEYPKWIRGHDEDVLVNSAEEEQELMQYNVPKTPVATVSTIAPVKNKGGRPKGTKNKPKTDRMEVND